MRDRVFKYGAKLLSGKDTARAVRPPSRAAVHENLNYTQKKSLSKSAILA